MSNIPQHVGYILDGNRRWAKSQGLHVVKGHERGKSVVRDIAQATFSAGVHYVTVYAFSTENWQRRAIEVDFLMRTVVEALGEYTQEFLDNDIRIMILGDKNRLPPLVQEAIIKAEEATAHCRTAYFGVCLNYGGQAEIVHAVKTALREGITETAIDEEVLAKHLYAPEFPPCDLIVRTSGEMRLSNFMLWRAAYSELMFIDKMWPDMTKQDVTAILDEYKRRGRRFGG